MVTKLKADLNQSPFSVLVENGLNPKKFNVYPQEIDIYKYKISCDSLLEFGLSYEQIREKYGRIPSIKNYLPKGKRVRISGVKNETLKPKKVRVSKKNVDYSTLGNIVDLSTIEGFDSFIEDKETQLSFYERNNSTDNVLKLAALNNKTFGAAMEKIIRTVFNLSNPTKTTHDMCLLDYEFEHKSSKFWVSTNNWKWQHVMIGLDYDYLILSGLNFSGINSFIISKDEVLRLNESGLIVRQQGGGEGQGLWFDYKDIAPYLTAIETTDDIINYIKNN